MTIRRHAEEYWPLYLGGLAVAGFLAILFWAELIAQEQTAQLIEQCGTANVIQVDLNTSEPGSSIIIRVEANESE